MSGHAGFDAPTAEALRASGAPKWNAFPDCIGAFVAEMDFGTAPEVMAAVRGALERNQFGYPTDALAGELATACSQWHAEHYGWEPDPARIQPLPDVLTGLEMALRHFLPAGTKVVLPTPNYMPFLPLLRMLGHEAVQVPMLETADGWRFDFDALDAAFAGGAGLAILCNPHNPLGRVFVRDELERFSEIAERHGVRVFCDEIHAPLVFAPHRHVPYASVSEAAARPGSVRGGVVWGQGGGGRRGWGGRGRGRERGGRGATGGGRAGAAGRGGCGGGRPGGEHGGHPRRPPRAGRAARPAARGHRA